MASGAECCRGVLAATVGVVNQPLRSALGEGHVQGVGDQWGSEVVAHGPAHYSPGPDIDDRRQIQEPLCGWDIGDIGHPYAAWPIRCELPPHQVGRHSLRRVAAGGCDPLAAVNSLDTGLAHQPGHPLAAHRHTLSQQLRVEAGHPICASRPAVDVHDPVPECPIRHLPNRGAAPEPCVVAGGGDTQQLAHAPHRIGGLISFHEPKRRRGVDPVSSANQAAA